MAYQISQKSKNYKCFDEIFIKKYKEQKNIFEFKYLKKFIFNNIQAINM